MQNDQDLIEETKAHKSAIDEASNVLAKAALEGAGSPVDAPAPERVQRLAMFHVDVPWPAGREIREMKIEVPLPATYLSGFLAIQAPNPLLVTPGEAPKPIVVLRLVFQGSPDAQNAFRHVIAQPLGTAMGFPEGMPEEAKPVVIDCVHNPMSGSVICIWMDPPDAAEPTEIPFFDPTPQKVSAAQAEVPAIDHVVTAPDGGS